MLTKKSSKEGEQSSNKVANAGIAREHLEQLIRQNNERKQILHLNRNRIQQLYRMYGGSYNKLRHSFLTPDGLVHKGNRGRHKLSIEELNKIKEQQQGRHHSLLPQPTINTPPTSKERKKQNSAAPEINVVPLPQVPDKHHRHNKYNRLRITSGRILM